MELGRYIEDIHRQFALAAEAGDEDVRLLAERLVAPLDAAIRLALQDVLTAAAEEITLDLAPGSVEVRLRGRDLELVVTRPPADSETSLPPRVDKSGLAEPTGSATEGGTTDDGSMARINLRLAEQLKGRVEQAAAQENVSVNSWIVRAAAARLEQLADPRLQPSPAAFRSQRFTGWAR